MIFGPIQFLRQVRVDFYKNGLKARAEDSWLRVNWGNLAAQVINRVLQSSRLLGDQTTHMYESAEPAMRARGAVPPQSRWSSKHRMQHPAFELQG